MSTILSARMLAATVLSIVSLAATAADVQVKCEKRSNRSKASVDGSNLADGSYRAVLKSGTSTARTGFQATIGDEVGFDFDSRAADIADGATAIPADFIVDGRVRGYLLDASGRRVTSVVTATCRIRP
jgi:hypothetical protein